jgi:hypothetical protein
VQVVGYRTAGAATETATLLLSDAAPGDGTADVAAVALAPGTELSYVLGDRRCAGAVHAGGHEPCGAAAAPYCDAHDSTWVCARCTGTCLKDEMDCHDDHAVYLAAFAPASFKVGVTRAERLETRLYEQGADRAAHLRTVSNGRVAREVEAGIAASVGDSVRVATKVAGLGRPVDEAAWDALCAEYDPRRTWRPGHDLGLTERPVAETLAAGRVRGTKGRVLVLEREGTTYAVDLRDLVGHEVERGETERSLQSSLGAF